MLRVNFRSISRGFSTKTDPFNSFISRSSKRVDPSIIPSSLGQSIPTASNRDTNLESSAAKLSGTSYSLKDNFNHELSTAASRILSNFNSPYSATVASLIESQGATLAGKNNMDEFGMGSLNTNSYFGATINPIYIDDFHIAGGSSGGSAAAVAADIVDFSLGTDTGGSVRLPASFCQVIGFKPSYGRISRWGVISYAQTLDTVGILSKNLDLIESVYDILDKPDSKDPTSLPQEVRDEIASSSSLYSAKSLTFGIPEEFLVEELSESNRQNWLDVLSRLQDLGHKVVSISIPSIKRLLLAYYTIATAEAASNLSRYDGIRYGFSEEKSQHKDIVTRNRSNGFGLEVQKRILLGNYTLSSDSGNHYLKATEARKQLVDEFNGIFRFPNHLTGSPPTSSTVDILISPTSIGNTPTIKEYYEKDNENFLNSYVNDLLTVPASLAGLPAISIPFGEDQCGIQLMAQFGDEKTLFNAAREINNMPE